MKTLKTECVRIDQEEYGDGEAVFWGEFWETYGNWQVVKGELAPSPGMRFPDEVWVGGRKIGELGDYVKLIVPPEGMLPLGAKVDYLEAQLGLQEQREEGLQVIADRYEKALREIAEPESQSDWERVATRRRRRAQEALDD